MNRNQVSLGLALLALAGSLSLADPLGTAFTYQGQLTTNGAPINGACDFRVVLYDSVAGGSIIGSTNWTPGVLLTNGIFTMTLDFGPAAFDGQARWLDFGVKPAGSTNAYATLLPRQPVTPAPYALTSGKVLGTIPDTQLPANIARLNGSQTFTDSVTLSNAAGRFSGSFAGDGANLTNLNGAAIQSNTIPRTALAFAISTNAGGGAASIAGLDGSGTNTVLTTTKAKRTFTVGGVDYPGGMMKLMDIPADSGWGMSNRVVLVLSNGTDWSGIQFQGISGSGGLTFWPDHGRQYWDHDDPATYSAPELLVQSSGSLCMDWGSGFQNTALQMGVAYEYGNFIYSQGADNLQHPLPWLPNCGYSVPWMAAPGYSADGTNSSRANCGGGPQAMSAWQFLARDTNGNTEFVVWDTLDYLLMDNQPNWAGSKARLRVLLGSGGGLDLRGKIVQERTATAPATASVALDFNSSQCVDISPAATSVAFYTTNKSNQGTNFEQRVFVVRGQAGDLATTWPTNWSWLTAAPAKVAAGTLLRLQLESIGPGESNVLASASSARDYTSAIKP